MPFSSAYGIKAVPPYDFSLTVQKPAGWSLLTPFEIFENGALWTAMRTPFGETFGLKLRSEGTVHKPKFFCEAYSRRKLGMKDRKELSATITWMLNLEEDIRQFYALAERDPLVKILVKDLYGMRITKRPDIFPKLVLAVTLQMAPIRRSEQMMNLLIKEYGEKIGLGGKEILYWPSPKRIAKADVRELEERYKLGYRAKNLKSIAESVSKGFPTIQQLERISAEEARAKLKELKGIGEYSADIVSPHPGFALDVWSAKIFSVLIFREKAESPRDVIPTLKKAAGQRWGKWRGYVFIYVLHALDELSRKYNLDLNRL